MREGSIKQARRKKKQNKIKLIVLLIFLLLLAASAFVVVKVYTVENVVVEGNELYEDSLIAQTVLQDEYSWNSLYVYWKYRFTKIDDVPFVDAMEVTLDGPHTVHIMVYEKGIMGYLALEAAGGNVFFDKDGIVVEISGNMIPDVPRVAGIACEEVVLYEKLPIKNSELKEILTLTQSLKRNSLIPDIILYGDINSPILYYGSIRVQIGSQELLTQKVERLNKILPSLVGESGVLHLENWTQETTNIVFDKDL